MNIVLDRVMILVVWFFPKFCTPFLIEIDQVIVQREFFFTFIYTS